MRWDLLAQAPLAVQIHLATVLPAFGIGTWQILASAKGTPPHRFCGYLYMGLMVATAIAAIFIHEINEGHLSLVHLFVPLTLWGVYAGLRSARRGDIKGHRGAMLGLYIGGLLIAGGLTFAPGRLMNRLIFG
ncbi:MAG: DUF2306 domain-containing protein [Acetobacteraceae bacterium]